MTRGVAKIGLFVALGALLLAGCGGVNQAAVEAQPLACPTGSDCYDPPLPVGPGGKLEVEAGEFYFKILSGQLVDGPNEITLHNVGGATHNFRIDAAAGDQKKVEAQAGETVTGTLYLFAGDVTYYCDIPGHRAAGMEGQATVLAADEAGAGGGGASSSASPSAGGSEPAPAPSAS